MLKAVNSIIIGADMTIFYVLYGNVGKTVKKYILVK